MVEPTASREFGPEEVGLALRNHGMLLEGRATTSPRWGCIIS
jgi:hypothetical protein